MLNLDELKEKSAKSIVGNAALEKQFDFFADAICQAPEMPGIWHGGGKTSGTQFKNIKFCWRAPSGKWIELSLYDTFAGSLNVNGNKVSIKSIATEKSAMEAFESAFRYVFGE